MADENSKRFSVLEYQLRLSNMNEKLYAESL